MNTEIVEAVKLPTTTIALTDCFENRIDHIGVGQSLLLRLRGMIGQSAHSDPRARRPGDSRGTQPASLSMNCPLRVISQLRRRDKLLALPLHVNSVWERCPIRTLSSVTTFPFTHGGGDSGAILPHVSNFSTSLLRFLTC